MSIKSIITVCAWILATNIQAQPVATGSGTENDPYNVQAAIDYVKSLGTNVPSENNVYVKGYVVELRSFPLVSGEATFIISDNFEAANEFQAYRVRGLGNEPMNGSFKMKPGDEVVLCGKVVNYNGSTPETVSGQAYIYSLTEGSGFPPVTNMADVPAFPGAEGHGRYTPGGRDGKIVHVTNLNDSGEGSLREAVKDDEPKVVVFDVGGVIPLESQLNIGKNTTIAGQTAPSPGITLRYYTVRPNTNNVIRFLRVRRGQERDVNDGADAIWNRYKTAMMIDHCSFSWSIDEVASFLHNNNFTMQWCNVSEPLTNSGHDKGSHGYGGIWGGVLASFHHNMIAHANNRVPRFNGARDKLAIFYSNTLYDTYQWNNSVQAENVDFRNCLVYNWGIGNGCYGGDGGGYINMVNNYFKAGPATLNRLRLTELSVSSDDELMGMSSRYFISGNYMAEAGENAPYYDWQGVDYHGIFDEIDGAKYMPDPHLLYGDNVEHRLNAEGVSCVAVKSDIPAPAGEVTTHKAETAYEKVLNYVGASLHRDEVDERHTTEARNGTATYTGSISGLPGIIDLVSDVNGYTEATFPIGQRPTGFDTDRDGMPDEWETANGLNPNDASDAWAYTIDPQGWYPNVEVYLNSLVQDIMLAGNADAEQAVEEYYPAYRKEDGTLVAAINGQSAVTNVLYALTEGESIPSGTTIVRDNITMTYGETGGPDFFGAIYEPLNDDFQYFTQGNNVNGNKAGGTFYVFNPLKDGLITVGIRQNRSKMLYVEENGTVMSQFNGITLTEEQPDAYLLRIPVKAGNTYKLYCTGSKLGFYGFTFDWSDGATVIHNIKSTITTSRNTYYNLTGQQLSKPRKGINIIDGRKVVLK